MRIPRILLIIALGTGFALGLVASASAGTLKTSALFLGGPSSQNVCVAINVGGSQMTITVQMFGLTSTSSDTCVVQPNDVDSSCQVSLNEFAFCKVTAPSISNVRAVMMNRQITSPFTIFATSEAR